MRGLQIGGGAQIGALIASVDDGCRRIDAKYLKPCRAKGNSGGQPGDATARDDNVFMSCPWSADNPSFGFEKQAATNCDKNASKS